jgi:hypothetical protein
LCSATVVYAANGGAADCIKGVAGWIASKLGADQEWNLTAFQVGVSAGQWKEAVSAALDLICQGL